MSDSFKTDKILDKHLQVLRSEDKSLSSLSISTEGNGARVSGDLETTGDINGLEISNTIIKSDVDIKLDSGGDITLDATGTDSAFAVGGTSYLTWSGLGRLTLKSVVDTDNYCQIEVGTRGVTQLITQDDDGETAHLTLDVDGDIILDSHTGNFIAEKAGTEFSAANSAYAGMLLGCSHVFGSGATGQYIQTSTAWENLVWDTDKFALVTFVVPPSNIVKISVHLPFISAASYEVRLGLATDDSATTLGTKYENDVDDANRADNFNINYSWVVEGSDHSWSAGETKTLYIMAYGSNSVRFYTGGTNTSGYGGVIVEATALPAIIGDGSEP